MSEAHPGRDVTKRTIPDAPSATSRECEASEALDHEAVTHERVDDVGPEVAAPRRAGRDRAQNIATRLAVRSRIWALLPADARRTGGRIGLR